MALPVAVVLDRTPYGTGPLDLTPLIAENSLTWSSVVPGGFASCSFQLDGDFRRLVKQVPYLSILRVIGDSGRVLFEGQIEDLAPTLSENSVGLKVGAFGLQNLLRELSVHAIWSKRDMNWLNPITDPLNVAWAPGYQADPSINVTTGNFDNTDPTLSGVRVASNGGVTVPSGGGGFAEWFVPGSLNCTTWMGEVNITPSGSSAWSAAWYQADAGANYTFISSSTAVGPFGFTLGVTGNSFRCGAANRSGAGSAIPVGQTIDFYDMRFLARIAEDTTDGFYGGSLLADIIGTFVPGLTAGVIEAGSDFTIDHLDASTRRMALDVVNEVAQYYAREWAVWEDAKLDWTTPNLARPEWIIPIAQLSHLDLDASVQNSQSVAYVLYTDAASGREAEASLATSDRRNPYVLNGRVKANLTSPGFAMTSNTSAQFASRILRDIGYGPVPAAGTIALAGDTIVQHAEGNAAKAWEIRAGDNVTIPELPLADVFTQDGRGECLFHVISAESNASSGTVTLSLDSYGSKRSDVLLARLAAVTSALGG